MARGIFIFGNGMVAPLEGPQTLIDGRGLVWINTIRKVSFKTSITGHSFHMLSSPARSALLSAKWRAGLSASNPSHAIVFGNIAEDIRGSVDQKSLT